MKNILKYAFVWLLLAASSCSDFLIEQPKNFIAPNAFYTTEGEVTSALYGCYRFQEYANIGDYFWLHMGMDGADEVTTRSLAVYNFFLNYEMDAQPIDASYVWRDHYAAIGAVNQFINRVQNGSLSDNFKKQVTGEAKYLRALMYHHLVLVWGDVPMWLNEIDLNAVSVLPRTPKSQVVAQIYKDLNEAAASMTTTSPEKGRANAFIAKGLLARVALFNNDWQTAYTMAKEVISGNGTPYKLQTNYADIFSINNKFNSELMAVVPFLTIVYGNTISSHSSPRAVDEQAAFNPLFAAGNKAIHPDGTIITASNQMFEGWGMVTVLKNCYDAFETGDTRRDMIWHTVTMTDGSVVSLKGGAGGGVGYYTLKWIARGQSPNNTSRDVHLMRLGEVYLILAEAANELNKPTEAVDALNALRTRAFKNTLKNYSATLTKDQIKSTIIKENRLELFSEGLRRWYLIHWGYDYLYNAVQSVKDETSMTKTAAANIKPNHVLFRVPDPEIAKNPNLAPNNPGYN